MSVFDELLESNHAYAKNFGKGDLPAPPARHLAVVACMDARILPLEVFGLGPGDAHVLRNAGGRVTDDVLRSLLVSTYVLGVRAVAVVHHTECGMVRYGDDELRQLTGTNVEFYAIADPDTALRDDVAKLEAAPFPEGIEIHGLRYDVRTGLLERVL